MQAGDVIRSAFQKDRPDSCVEREEKAGETEGRSSVCRGGASGGWTGL